MIRRPLSADRARRGFTLIELAVGMTLAGLMLVGTGMLLRVTQDTQQQILYEAERTDAKANGTRLLANIVANVESSSDSLKHFVGDSARIEFNTRCVVPQGWAESCRVALQLSASSKGSDLSWSRDSTFTTLRHFDRVVEFRYERADGSDGWRSQWDSGIMFPGAVAVVAEGDTIVLGGTGR